MYEIDYLMQIDTQGIVTYEDEMAVFCQITEWLDTEVGDVWGAPNWGCPVKMYMHLPVNEDTAGIIESSLATKIAEDLPNITISAVGAKPLNSDGYHIQFATPYYSDLIGSTKLVKDS